MSLVNLRICCLSVDDKNWIKTAEAGISLEEAAAYAGVKWVGA